MLECRTCSSPIQYKSSKGLGSKYIDKRFCDISYYSTEVSKEEITAILEKDTAVIKDITDTFPLLKERVPHMELCNGSAVIIDIAEERIAYTITSAGQLFGGVKDTIAKLQDKDIDVFIASGDRSGAIKKLANITGIPESHDGW